jgi:predicted HAD superfamily phosphohydrolase YqeG
MPRDDLLSTLRQTIPRLWRLRNYLEPTFHLDTVAAIDAAFLQRHGVRAVLWDVDGTVMSFHGGDVDPAFPHVRDLFRDGPGRHAILSNCHESRFEELGRMFPEVPIVRAYSTANGPIFRVKQQGSDTHTSHEVSELLNAGGRQIRKPSGELVDYCMQLLGEKDPNSVLMVGDQYLTDVASANLAGIRSAKVRTFRRDTFPRAIRFSQSLEAMLYRAMNGMR